MMLAVKAVTEITTKLVSCRPTNLLIFALYGIYTYHEMEPSHSLTDGQNTFLGHAVCFHFITTFDLVGMQ